jgi:integrase
MAKRGIRTAKRLNNLLVQNLRAAGKHPDGDGLYLWISPTGNKSWLFLFQYFGKRKEMGLGSVRDVSLAEARAAASDARQYVAAGKNPITERKLGLVQRRDEPFFKEFAEEYVASHESEWKNAKHRAQWKMTLDVYAKPLHHKLFSDISTSDIYELLKPIWKTKSETASRLRGRIEKVWGAASMKGYCSGENPARWEGRLEHLLTKPKKLTRGHFASMPYEDLPAFMIELRKRNAWSARALEFHILCASRPGMVENMRASDIDWENAVWKVPKELMKLDRDHEIPLSGPAMAVLHSVRHRIRKDVVFAAIHPGTRMSNNALRNLMKRLDVGHFTPHGFRSSFTDWAGDETEHEEKVTELALAHSVGDGTKKAYRRRQALDKRRRLMEDWATYLASGVIDRTVAAE